MTDISPELMFVIGLVASAIVWLVKLASQRGETIPSGWLTAGVYVVSAVLAFLFAPVSLPSFPCWSGDLATFVPAVLTWIGNLLVPLSAFVGFATLIYNAILKKVLDGIADKLATKG